MNKNLPAYVLITPARNEEEFLELTIKSVVSQTARPLKWVIVSDGSTDGTDEIVRKYAVQHDWIILVHLPTRAERHFAGKVGAFFAGYDRVKKLNYEVIGNLDADISFGPDYIAFLMSKFAENPRLGIAGTPYTESGELTYDYRFASTEDVAGACQLFRRECFDVIGGYKPMRSGGVDLAAVLKARMSGWQTRCYLEKSCIHARPVGSATRKGVKQFLHAGMKDFDLGCHPLWELGRAVHHLRKRPHVIVSACLLAGYFSSMLLRNKRTMPAELVAFRQKEQMARLKVIFGLSSAKTRAAFSTQRPLDPLAEGSGPCGKSPTSTLQ